MREEQGSRKEISIKKAEEKDVEAITRLRLLSLKHSAAFDPYFVLADVTEKRLVEITQQELAEVNIVHLLATSEKRVIGLAIVQFLNEAENMAFLTQLFVDEEYRNRGVAVQLLSGVMQVTKERDCNKLGLSVAKANKEAQKLYRKLGFRPKENLFLLFEKEI